MRNPFVNTLIAVSLVLFSAPAWSLGLGDARAESFIGQPLSLRIELLTSPNDDLDSVTARLGSAEDFALVGASRGAITVPLTFSIHESPEGASILVQSRVSVNDPVLRLVVEVTWSSGRMLREYTVFLDPPTVPAQPPRAPTTQTPASPTPSPAPQPPESAEPVSESAYVTTEAETPPPVESEPAAVSESSESAEVSAREGSYGPIQSGETLWRIASDWVGDTGMDMSQVMLAIQRKNPDAFMRDNINLLKRGAHLEMPSEQEVTELSQARARELVAQQEAAFRMRSSMAAASTPLIAADTGETIGRSTPAAASTPDPLQEDTARLEIVPPSEEDLAGRPGTGAVPGGEGSDELARDLREELARTEEELFSERQQNTYLRERIAELESQLELGEGEAGQGVSDTGFAQFQERLQSERLAEEAAADDVGEQAEAEQAAPEIPQVVTTTADEGETAWYNSGIARLVMIVIVVAAIGGWLYSRRRSYVDYDTQLDEVGDLEESAADDFTEEVSDSGGARPSGLGVDSDPRHETPETVTGDDDRWGITYHGVEDEPTVEEAPAEDEVEVVSLESARRQRTHSDPEATILDESSSDPEIKLDLARAYISMGDKEAARVILNEVLSVGTEAQQGEARSMLDEL